APRPRHLPPTVDVAAGDGAALVVRVCRRRPDQLALAPRLAMGGPLPGELLEPLVGVPAEVRQPEVGRGNAVDLLVAALPDVTDPEVACLPVEREGPRM